MTNLYSPSAGLLHVRGLRKWYVTKRGLWGKSADLVRAVDGVDFSIGTGETLALVGKSGCGKTTVGQSLLRLVEPTAGEAWFEGVNLFALSRAELRAHRRRIQIVFQDPLTSLDPELTIGASIGEGIDAFELAKDADDRQHRVVRALKLVRLDPSLERRFPAELSGGQRQRVGIARALAVEPRLVVCDEPTSALDVSVQAQVVNLLLDLQEQLGVAYLFITHNLVLARSIAHRVAIMQQGRIVEEGPADRVFANPQHPCTRLLLGQLQAHPVPEAES